MRSLLPFPDPFLLSDAFGVLHPLLFLGQPLLLEAGNTLSCRSQVDVLRRLAQPLG
ncbi:hypothetical protein [Bifidobacterium longum]|uniref:hypothetical protein n=1 Tax=Bifidobacterium longum TaxID=216816 RepID=UPI00256FD0B1|nr:hypothetical protein [Bifidobacterium longum]